ncbi:hypothetical protein ME121_0234 [Methylobacterium sp. ME121]|jgi:hypothetical protein|nr:hypothetical protein ME121_0234 [Methylobacterium sp. ME121]
MTPAAEARGERGHRGAAADLFDARPEATTRGPAAQRGSLSWVHRHPGRRRCIGRAANDFGDRRDLRVRSGVLGIRARGRTPDDDGGHP